MTNDVFAEIIAFVPKLAPFLTDPDVTDIMVNPDGGVYTTREGVKRREECVIPSIDLEPAVQIIARGRGEDVGEHRPTLETRLDDGSRIAAAFPPVSVGGILFSIRRFPRRYTTRELVDRGMLIESDLEVLAEEIQARRNIMISGSTGTGKTTLLNTLTEFIPASERLIVIEDTAEIWLEGKENVGRLEARRQYGKNEAVTIRDCLRHTLRHCPDRIFVGEVRGPEAHDLLEAWNTGHSGSMSTIHADTAERSLYKLANAALQAGIIRDVQLVRALIADCLDTVVHIRRDEEGRRHVEQILRVAGYDEHEGRFQFEPLMARKGPGHVLAFAANVQIAGKV